MNTKDAISLAEKCGACTNKEHWEEFPYSISFDTDSLAIFAKSIADLQKEKDAQICEASKDTGDSAGIERDVKLWNKAIDYCTRAIRSPESNMDEALRHD